jgi:hypothetical protein
MVRCFDVVLLWVSDSTSHFTNEVVQRVQKSFKVLCVAMDENSVDVIIQNVFE